MAEKYLHTNDFLTYKRKTTDSPIWKNLLNCRALVKQGIIWKVGNGESISFWYDNWIENKNLIDLLELNEEIVISPQAKVPKFIQQDRSWNFAKLNDILD